MNYPFNITTYETHTRIIQGWNCISRLKDELERIDPRRIIIFAGKNVGKTDFFNNCLRYVEEGNIPYVIFDDILPEAPVDMVLKASALMTSQGCDLAIAVGGGSCIDLAKAAAVVATNGGKPQDYTGYEVFRIPPIPLIAIPTTAGTSSEVTAMAIIHDEEKDLKFTIAHRELNCPRIAFLDPQSLASCPRKVIAEAGIDAFSHAFESFISLRANPHTEALSIQGIRLISRNLRALYSNSGNIFAGANMLAANTMGGMAFTTTGTGNIHCLGRFLGPKLGLSHGLVNGLLFPYVARFNHPACPSKFSQIAQAMDVDVTGLGEHEAGLRAIEEIERLCSDINIGKKTINVTCSKDDIESVAEEAWKAYSKTYRHINPRMTNKEDLLQIMEEAFC